MTALATDQGLAGLWFDGQKHHPGPLLVPEDAQHPLLQATAGWLRAYWARTPDNEPLPALDLSSGTPFQRRPHGAAIAAAAASPAAVRAAGAAIGRNPISLIVPCHRVLGSGGGLTGYAGGLDHKRALLDHEGAVVR